MALTAKQRNALPKSAFAIPSKRAYPMPTKTQARRAGIGERQRLRMVRNALARSGQRHTRGSYPTVARKARTMAGNAVASVGVTRGTVSRPGYAKRRKRGRTRSRRRTTGR